MIPTATILAAFKQRLDSLAIFDRVETFPHADFAAAFESLRDPSRRLGFIIPGTDTYEHQLAALSMPVQAELRSQVHILASTQSATYTRTGDPDALAIKDTLLDTLCWDNLGLPDFICLPQTCEPLRLEWDDAPARFAWQLTLEARHLLR